LTTEYNPDGTVADQKDGKNNAIQTYTYDSLAHVTTVTDALTNITTYVYDAYGNLLSKQDPGGNCSAQPATSCTTYSYDAANQLTGINYSDGVTPNVSNITYDGDGQRVSMTDGTGTSSWGWDSLHRMVSYTNGGGAQMQWQYNLRNLPTTITYPGTLNVTRGYDNAGRWTSVQDWNSNTTTFGYDADSNLTTETFPAASTVVDTFAFNAVDQITNVASVKGGSTTLFSAGYTRDASNQLTGDSSAASGTGSYKYTPLNQVCYAGSSNTNACSSPPSGSIAYAYDTADNLTRKSSIQQVFNNADELCWTASTSGACSTPPSGATSFQYDARGNRTNVTPTGGQAQTLTYDQVNRLTTYVASSTTTYGYNGDGLRMCKYSGTSNQPCSAVGATQFVWDEANAMPSLVKDGSALYIYGPGRLPLEQVTTSAVWYHHDQLGSTRLITDATGASQATYTYDPYGALVASSGSITNPSAYPLYSAGSSSMWVGGSDEMHPAQAAPAGL
jgi:YD repeat-containing protein